jgi:hypothetical protein
MRGLELVGVDHLPAAAGKGREAGTRDAGLGHRTHGVTVYRRRIRVRLRSNRRRLVGPVTPHSDRWRSVTVTDRSHRTPVARAKLHEVIGLDNRRRCPTGDDRARADRWLMASPDAPAT